ncbi:MAG: hypothetical protein DMD40_11415 [Gemmatimonadetes bacterium]|nr:MAG: hypothetical protein DMD40_11415 [Gemmatimonadota bacterium]
MPRATRSAATRCNSSKSWAAPSSRSPSNSTHCAAYSPEWRRLRVLQVDSGRGWRGGQNQVRLLCRELSRAPKIEQALVTKHASELAQRAAADGVSVLGTAWDIGLDPRAWWHLRRTVAAFQPDVIHVHDSHALTLVAPVARSRRIVATRRVEFHIGRFGSWRRPDRIIAISEAVKKVLIADGIDPGAIVVVHDGIDVDEVRKAGAVPLDIRGESGIPASARVAVNAAALTGEKDHRTLIRAAHYARAKRPDLHWVIAGEGKLRDSLAAEIRRLAAFPKSSRRRCWSPPRTRKRWPRRSPLRSITPHRCPSRLGSPLPRWRRESWTCTGRFSRLQGHDLRLRAGPQRSEHGRARVLEGPSGVHRVRAGIPDHRVRRCLDRRHRGRSDLVRAGAAADRDQTSDAPGLCAEPRGAAAARTEPHR